MLITARRAAESRRLTYWRKHEIDFDQLRGHVGSGRGCRNSFGKGLPQRRRCWWYRWPRRWPPRFDRCCRWLRRRASHGEQSGETAAGHDRPGSDDHAGPPDSSQNLELSVGAADDGQYERGLDSRAVARTVLQKSSMITRLAGRASDCCVFRADDLGVASPRARGRWVAGQATAAQAQDPLRPRVSRASVVHTPNC